MGCTDFCLQTLLSIGLKMNDFKIGTDTIFFRSTKFDLIEKFQVDLEKTPDLPLKMIEQALVNRALIRSKWRRAIHCILSMFNFFYTSTTDKTIYHFLTRIAEIKTNKLSENSKESIGNQNVIPNSVRETYEQNVLLENVDPKPIEATSVEKTAPKRCLKENGSNLVSKKRTKPNEARPVHSLRYDQVGHFPNKNKSKLGRCKKEGCGKKTNVYCLKCKVHLCFVDDRNCFTSFHFIDGVIPAYV